MRRLRGRKSAFRATASCFLASILAQQPVAAHAQQVPENVTDEGEVSKDIVVTAQRREQRLQDVPIAVSALDGEQLASRGVFRAIDIVTQIPGIQVSAAGGGTVNAFNIRGVTQNAFAASLESPIAVYQDESYISSNSIVNLSVFDIDRVEVLRGPQGTLFGRNANGGVVRYITARPTDQSDGFLSVDLGSSGRIRMEGAVSGPLTEGLNFRVSGIRNRDNGLMKNDIGRNAQQTDDYAIRGQIAFKSSNLDGLFKVQFMKEDSNRGGYSHTVARNGSEVTNPAIVDFFGYRDTDGDPFTGSFDFPGWNKNTVWDLTSVFNLALGDVVLTSATNYQDVKNDYAEDSDVSPNSVYHYNRGSNVNQFSQELRASLDTGPLNAVVGAYYLRISGNYYTNQFGEGFFGNQTERATADQVTRSYAFFGQATLDIDDKLSVELGARYSNDKKTYSYRSTNIFDIFRPGPVVFNKKFPDDGFSARGQINYRPNSSNLLYFGVNRGIKSGGLNFPLFPQDPALLPFNGETLTDYEGGWKATVARATTLNLSLFHYDYKGYQAFSFDGLATRVINANARMSGGEVEFQSRPLDGLELNLGMSYLTNKVRDVPLAASLTGVERSPFSPRWTINGLVRYSWPAFDGNLHVQADGNWRDKQTFNLVVTPSQREPAYALFNANVGFTSDDGWSISAYVHNLFDQRYRMQSFDTSRDWGANEDTFGTRRWFGANLSYRW
ncbi:CirA Outer membrane receptor proteins, mostly Fe transport [Sphingomonadaceae bacterium]